MQRRNKFTNDVYAEGMHSQTTIDDKKQFGKNEIMKEEGPSDDISENLMPDDRLTIRHEGAEHLVDSIVQVRRAKVGGLRFKLAMCCLCCKAQTVWHSKAFIKQFGNQNLIMLAKQAEELSQIGVDIESEQRTSEGGTEDEQSENRFNDDQFTNNIGPEIDQFDLAMNRSSGSAKLASLELAGHGTTEHLLQLGQVNKQVLFEGKQKDECKSTEDLVERQN